MNVFGIAKVDKLEDYSLCANLKYNLDDPSVPSLIDPNMLQRLSINKCDNNLSSTFSAYNCVYDLKKNKKGHIDDLEFDHYFERKEFNSYKSTDDLFFMNVNTESFRGFVKKINAKSGGKCRLDIINIDFDYIELKSDNVYSIVVSGIQDAEIKAQALYGIQLSENPTYKKLKSKGTISSLTIGYIYNKVKYNVLISKKGTVWVKDSNLTNKEALSIVYDVYKNLLSK